MQHYQCIFLNFKNKQEHNKVSRLIKTKNDTMQSIIAAAKNNDRKNEEKMDWGYFLAPPPPGLLVNVPKGSTEEDPLPPPKGSLNGSDGPEPVELPPNGSDEKNGSLDLLPEAP